MLDAVPIFDRENLLARRVRLPVNASSIDISRTRRLLAERARELARLSKNGICPVKEPIYDNQTREAAALDSVAEQNPALIPDPGPRPAEFNTDDFARVRAFASAPLPALPRDKTLSMFADISQLFEIAHAQGDLDRELVRLRMARNSGRLSDAVDGSYPHGEAFLALARSTAGLIKQSTSKLDALEDRMNELENQIARAMAGWAISLILLAFSFKVAMNWLANRRDRRVLASLFGKPAHELCVELLKPSSSDWLRQRVRSALADLDVNMQDLATIEEAVQSLGGRRNERDLRFAMELGETVTDLHKRALR